MHFGQFNCRRIYNAFVSYWNGMPNRCKPTRKNLRTFWILKIIRDCVVVNALDKLHIEKIPVICLCIEESVILIIVGGNIILTWCVGLQSKDLRPFQTKPGGMSFWQERFWHNISPNTQRIVMFVTWCNWKIHRRRRRVRLVLDLRFLYTHQPYRTPNPVGAELFWRNINSCISDFSQD